MRETRDKRAKRVEKFTAPGPARYGLRFFDALGHVTAVHFFETRRERKAFAS